MRRFVASLLPAAAVLVGSVADVPFPETQPKEKWVIFSDADTIEGSRGTPAGDPLIGRKQVKQPSLLKVRINFVREILRSAEDI